MAEGAGDSSASSPALPYEERRLVTVLFADIEASTELAVRLDPEDLRAVLRPFFDAMREEIERHGGSVEKFIGDAVVGVFGAPVAHEDDPERAVRAALAMHDRLGRLNVTLAAAAGGDLAMRIGVNTGEVLASSRTGEHEGMITGEAVNLAARLQATAAPGAVVVGERTYRHTRYAFGFVSLVIESVKGFGGKVTAWRVAPELSPSAEPAWRASPMVGRSEELGLLRLVLGRTLAERRPNLVTVLGAPGIGKSRLAREFAVEVGAEPASSGAAVRVLRGRCVPYGNGLTYWPLAEMLKSEAGILDSDAPEMVLGKARTHLDASIPVDEQTPGLNDVLLSSIGISTGTDPLAGTDSSAAQQTIIGAWRRYFEARSSARGLLAVFEDIHWADPSLLILIEALAGRVRGAVLFLCLSRPELVERRPEWGASLPNAMRFGLSPLTEGESATLVAHLLGGGVPGDLVRLILESVEGNPFFAGELIRMVTEDGTLERRDGGWALARPVPTSLPDTVQAVIMSRIDLLSPAQKRAIQDAAVVGRVFWQGALSRLGGHHATTIDELIERGLVWEREDSAIAGDRELIFGHGLTREVTYGSIPRARRAQAHGGVAAWIEEVTRGRDEEFAELLAHHAEHAGDDARTARYAMLAGHRHRRVFAADEAIGWYDRALAAAGRLSDGAASLLIGETALSRGEAHEQLGRFEEARADYQRALDVSRNGPGDRGWLEARALASIVHVLWMQDRFDESRRLVPAALELARSAGQPDIEIRLLYTQGTIAFDTGRPDESLEFHSRALRVAEEIGDAEGQALAHHGLADCRLLIGPLRVGLMHGERADALLRELGQRLMLHHNQYTPAWIHWMLGELGDAEALARASADGCRELGARRDEGFALTILGLIGLARFDLRLAMESGHQSVSLALDVDAPRLELLARASLLYTLAELGDQRAVAENLAAALAAARRVEGDFLGAVLAAFRGWLEAAAGATATAKASFEDAARLSTGRMHDRAMSLWAEILCWERVSAADELRQAGERLIAASSDEGGLFAAWADYALARAALLDGAAPLAARLASDALARPEAVGQVSWRLHAILSTAAHTAGREDEARRSGEEASALLQHMIDALEPAAQATFLARPDLAFTDRGVMIQGPPTQA